MFEKGDIVKLKIDKYKSEYPWITKYNRCYVIEYIDKDQYYLEGCNQVFDKFMFEYPSNPVMVSVVEYDGNRLYSSIVDNEDDLRYEIDICRDMITPYNKILVDNGKEIKVIKK